MHGGRGGLPCHPDERAHALRSISDEGGRICFLILPEECRRAIQALLYAMTLLKKPQRDTDITEDIILSTLGFSLWTSVSSVVQPFRDLRGEKIEEPGVLTQADQADQPSQVDEIP